MSNGRLRVAQLKARNFKCITEVEIAPTGDIITIAGQPGQGKTSILEAIETALRGGDETLVRRGADHSEIFLAVGDLTVSRSIDTEGKQRLAVSQDGRPLGAQQAKALLAALFGPHVFRPIEWVSLSGGDAKGRVERLRRQRDELLHAIPIRLSEQDLVAAVKELGDEALGVLGEVHVEVDLERQHGLVVCESLRKASYDARAVANRQVEEAETVLRTVPVPPRDVPSEPLDFLVRQEKQAEQAYQQALGAQRAQATSRARAQQLRELIASETQALAGARLADETTIVTEGQQVAQQIQDLDRQIAELQRQRTQLEARRSDLRDELSRSRELNDELRRRQKAHERNIAELADLEGTLGRGAGDDPSLLEKALEKARDRRWARELQEKHNTAAAKVQDLRRRADALDGLVTLFRETLPARLLQTAPFPIEGLGLDGEQITIHSVPIHRLGTSEQIRLGVKVAVALNQRAGFVCVDGAESLGAEGRQELAAAAQEHGVQLWMSEVTESPAPGSIVMHDGAAQFATV